MACSSCGGNKNTNKNGNARSANLAQASIQKTSLLGSIPENKQMKVRYISGGTYRHKIISPNGSIFKYGYSNYGYGKNGDELIIDADDYPIRDGRRQYFQQIVVENKVVTDVTEVNITNTVVDINSPTIVDEDTNTIVGDDNELIDINDDTIVKRSVKKKSTKKVVDLMESLR